MNTLLQVTHANCRLTSVPKVVIQTILLSTVILAACSDSNTTAVITHNTVSPDITDNQPPIAEVATQARYR